MKIKTILVLFLICLATGCMKEPENVLETTNSNFNVSKLFTHENCTIFRFVDGGHLHYYVNCQDAILNQNAIYCGIGCVNTEYDTIPTKRCNNDN